jgi:hypothetical protein
MDKNYRVDFYHVSDLDKGSFDTSTSDIKQMQAKLNQWATKGELVSFKAHVLPQTHISYMVFEVIRIKS